MFGLFIAFVTIIFEIVGLSFLSIAKKPRPSPPASALHINKYHSPTLRKRQRRVA
jgi:hypothetical protein